MVKRVFKFREGPHLLDKVNKKHDFQYPLPQHLSYDNCIAGIEHCSNFYRGINIVMTDGSTSSLPFNSQDKAWFRESRIDQQKAPIRKVIMRGDSDNSEFGGCQFFAEDGDKLLEASFTVGVMREFSLAPGERLVGIKSQMRIYSSLPRQNDLVFLIGWLE